MLAAGTVVPERMQIGPEVLAAGVPAAVKKELSGSSRRWTEMAADDYQIRRRLFLGASVVTHAD